MPYYPAGHDIDYHQAFVKKTYAGKLKNIFNKPLFMKYIVDVNNEREKIIKEDSEFLISHYDSCIKFVDIQFGKLIKFLKDSDKLKNTIVIFTADHGEQFFPTRTKGFKISSKNFVWHAGITSTILKVPLIIYIPCMKSKIVKTPVNAGIDILPTVIKLLRFNYMPKYKLSGKSLLKYTEQDQKKDNYVLTINPYFGLSLISSNKQYIIPKEDLLEKVFKDINNETYLDKEIPDKIIVADLGEHYKEYEFRNIKEPIRSVFKEKAIEIQELIKKL